ncbi:unnamed protein product [Thelazia callipaeda]|uniref:Cysteine desulfurase n=1 Tax=Thelazia callipaeda TaxID=103827 RepID=A0A0N5CRY0_THECL|nr:unnamed protein product [Thelazia callipaeda]
MYEMDSEMGVDKSYGLQVSAPQPTIDDVLQYLESNPRAAHISPHVYGSSCRARASAPGSAGVVRSFLRRGEEAMEPALAELVIDKAEANLAPLPKDNGE